ncbi:MAG: methyltransferase domain-containing protein [Phycisphaerae bacterium]
MAAKPILLDPRPEQVARARPIENAVNIPAAELAQRTYELPEPSERVHVAQVGAETQLAVHALRRSGRQSTVVRNWKHAMRPQQTLQLWLPSEFLANVTRGTEPGHRALDLGCGVGRDTVYLANQGWNVIGVDVLPDALERAGLMESRYRRYDAPIRWVKSDIRKWKDEIPEDITGPTRDFDLIFAVRFVSREAFGIAKSHLKNNGRMVVEAFTPTHRARHGKPKSDEDVITAEQLGAIAKSLEISVCRETWCRDAHLAQLCAVKR